MDKEEQLWNEREKMTEEEIQEVMAEEEAELEKLMMGFSSELGLAAKKEKESLGIVEEEEDDEEEVVKILPDGSIISEVKEAEEGKEEAKGLHIDPLLLVFGARLKVEVLKELRQEAYEVKDEMEQALQGRMNRWLSGEMNPVLTEMDARIKLLHEEIRLSTGFSDDVEDVIERANKRIEDKELEIEVMRRVDEKVKELLSLTKK